MKKEKGKLKNAPPQHWVKIGWSDALPTRRPHKAFRIVQIYQ